MAKEIERKFLVDVSKITYPEQFNRIVQGYIPRGNDTTVRVRVSDDIGYLTLKGKTVGFSRDEYEYEIPLNEAESMLTDFCDERLISKKRYLIEVGGKTWEVDVFLGKNKGLVVAELELGSEEEEFEIPNWVSKEVTDDKRYYNALLMSNPYSAW